jgi:hypothetical protein
MVLEAGKPKSMVPAFVQHLVKVFLLDGGGLHMVRQQAREFTFTIHSPGFCHPKSPFKGPTSKYN